MKRRATSVLLAGDLGTSSATLQKWLARRGCKCRLAASFRDACQNLSRAEFDLVLCRYDLPDRTAFPLLGWLKGTRSTLLLYANSDSDGRWLPVIERGKRCLDRPLLRTADLPSALAHILGGDGAGWSADEPKQTPNARGDVREVVCHWAPTKAEQQPSCLSR